VNGDWWRSKSPASRTFNPGHTLLKHFRKKKHKLSHVSRFMNTLVASLPFPQCRFHAFTWAYTSSIERERMENFASVSIMTGNSIQVIICWNAPGKHNILKRSRFMNARIATLRLPLMLVSRVCLGINVFDVNIEREGKEKAWQAFQQLGSGMLNFPVSALLFFSCLSFLWPFLRIIAKC